MKWAWPKELLRVLPSIYILAKRKSEFLKARSIICYHEFFFARMQRALGKVIYELTSEFIQDESFNCRSLDEVIAKLRDFNGTIDRFWDTNQGADVSVAIFTLADDLAGFFPAPPQKVMVRAAEWLCEQLVARKNCSLEDITISVCLDESKPAFFGKKKTSNNHRTFFMEFFLPLLLLVLECAVCDVRGTSKRQIRGGPIGAPVSPPWLILVVTLREHLWLSALESNRRDRFKTWSVARYVDNRYVLALKVAGHTELPIELFDSKFYGETVQLEPESRSVLVGTELLIPSAEVSTMFTPPRIECRYVVMGFPSTFHQGQTIDIAHLWRYRSPFSGSSRQNLMGAFLARLHLAKRASFPTKRCEEAIARLTTVYLMMGYPNKWLCSSLERFLKAHVCTSINWKIRFLGFLRSNDTVSLHRLGGV